MKKVIFTFGLFFALLFNANAQNDSIPQSIEQQKKAIKVATEWISMFYEGGNIDSLIKISKLPFAPENSKTLHSNEELEDIYTSIIEDKSQLKTPEVKAEIYTEEYTLFEELSPANFLLIILAITEEKGKRTEHLLVFVEIDGDNYSVIGFDD